MTQTIVLAPDVTAAQSADIVVAAGSTVSVHAYGTTPAVTNLGQLALLRKVGANYYPVCDDKGVNVYLGTARADLAIVAPGTYAVLRQVSANAVGVSSDS